MVNGEGCDTDLFKNFYYTSTNKPVQKTARA